MDNLVIFVSESKKLKEYHTFDRNFKSNIKEMKYEILGEIHTSDKLIISSSHSNEPPEPSVQNHIIPKSVESYGKFGLEVRNDTHNDLDMIKFCSDSLENPESTYTVVKN